MNATMDDSKEPHNLRCYLLELPGELRDQIYRTVLYRDEILRKSPIDFGSSIKPLPPVTSTRISLLQTCKRIHAEADPILYETVFFDCPFDITEYIWHRIRKARHNDPTLFDNFVSKVCNVFVDVQLHADIWTEADSARFEKFLQLFDACKLRRLHVRVWYKGKRRRDTRDAIPAATIENVLSPLRQVRQKADPALRIVLFNFKRLLLPGFRWTPPSARFREELGVELGSELARKEVLDPKVLGEEEFVKVFCKPSAWEVSDDLVAPEEAWPSFRGTD